MTNIKQQYFTLKSFRQFLSADRIIVYLKNNLYFLFALGCCLSLVSSCQALKLENIAANTEQNTVNIAVISDLNSQYGATEYEPEIDKAIQLIIKQWQPSLVLGGGDAIAGQKKSLTKSQIQAMWQAFDSHVAQPLRKNQIPYAFTIGNHDGSGAVKNNKLIFKQERDLAKAYWNNPQYSSALDFVDRGNFPFYYSFQQDNIFYLVWDASTHIINQEQLDWIEKNLRSKLAQQAQMRIAIGHLPLYAVAETKDKPGEYLAEAEKLRLLLEQYQVSIYISGHHHVYYPGKKGNLQLLHAGALGQGARQLIGSELLPRNTITLINIEPVNKSFTYTTYDIKTLQTIINDELPPYIVGKNSVILRQDVTSDRLSQIEEQTTSLP